MAAAAIRTAASDSTFVGCGGIAMVSLRSTGGRKSATVVGGDSTPSNVTAPLTNRSGLVGSRQ